MTRDEYESQSTVTSHTVMRPGAYGTATRYDGRRITGTITEVTSMAVTIGNVTSFKHQIRSFS